jgi:hypothetical protein
MRQTHRHRSICEHFLESPTGVGAVPRDFTPEPYGVRPRRLSLRDPIGEMLRLRLSLTGLAATILPVIQSASDRSPHAGRMPIPRRTSSSPAQRLVKRWSPAAIRPHRGPQGGPARHRREAPARLHGAVSPARKSLFMAAKVDAAVICRNYPEIDSNRNKVAWRRFRA